MKNILLVLIISLISQFTFGQGILQDSDTTSVRYGVRADELPVKKADYSFSTGTSFSTGAFSGSSYYFAPKLTYRFTPKFTLRTSVIFINSNITASNEVLNLGENQSRLFDRKTNETIVSATGDYQVNSKLLLTGSVIKNFNSPMGAKQGDAAWRNSFQMMSMGLQYKLTPNMTIGADFKMIQSNNPYNYLYYNPSGNLYGNPYSNF